ncbi:MAG TPA: hypothetical protein VGS08_02230 [Candidatus Saccharimonadales bacterium]|nr:hypothetical protein [Candidatus Saccharimonadales bacterium]
MACYNCLGVCDETRAKDIASGIRDAVRPNAFVENSQLLKMLEIGKTPANSSFHSLGNSACVAFPAPSALGARLGIAETKLPRFWKRQETEGFPVGRATRIAIAFGNEMEACVKVANELIVSTMPVTTVLLEDQERVNEERRVGVEDGVEPIILRPSGDIKNFTKQHAIPTI